MRRAQAPFSGQGLGSARCPEPARLCSNLRHATATLTNALQREPTIDELAHDLDVTAEQILRARLCASSYSPVPFGAPTGNDGSLELYDALGDPDPDLEILTDKLAVTGLVHLLPPLIQLIQRMLALRFFGNLTQAQIAAKFNISQMQVDRLLSRGLTWLSAAMLSDVPPPFIDGENAPYPDGVRIRVGRP